MFFPALLKQSDAQRSAEHQPPKAKDPALAELQHRLAAQRAATQSGDAPAVVQASQKLAALGLQQMANLRLLEGAAPQAAELYRQALALDDAEETRIDLAVALLRGKKPGDADAEIEKVLAADPKNARAWQVKGSEQLAREDYAGAARSLSRAVDLHLDVNALYALGSSLLKMHQPEQAAAVFHQIVELYGDKAIWHVVFGGAYRDTGYLDLAIPEFKRAITMDPKAGHAHFYLGLTYLQKNNWGANPESLSEFHQAILIEPKSYQVNFYLGALESGAKELAASNKHLQAAAEEDPSAPETWLYLGLNAFEQHDYVRAQEYLKKTIALTGSDEARNNYQIRRAYFVLGRIAVIEGRHDEGEKYLAHVKELQQKSLANSAETISSAMKEEGLRMAPGVVPMAEASVGTEAMAEVHPAEENADPAAALDPSLLARAHISPAETQEVEGREKQLRSVLADAYNDWGTADARQQQYAEALKQFQEAARWNDTTPGLMRNIGIAAFRVKDFSESARALEIVLRSEPEDGRSRMMLAMSQFSLGDFKAAATSFARVPDAVMADPRAAYAWAFSLARAGQQQQANRIVDTLSGMDLSPDVLSLVCHVYMDTENYEHAITCFKRAYAADSSLKKAHYEVGNALIRLDRPADAVPELEQELKVSPGDPNVQYLLAYALLQTSHKQEAETLLDTVVTADPDHAQAQYELGKLLLEQGSAEQAIGHLEASERVDPSPDYIHYQLGTAYRRAGRSADAERELQQYREIKAKHREIAPQHAMETPQPK